MASRRHKALAVIALILVLGMWPHAVAADAPWEPGQVVSDHPGSSNQSSPALAFSRDGWAYVAWWDNLNGANRIYLRARDPAANWQASVAPSIRGYAYQGAPALAVSDAGVLYLAWSNSETLVKPRFDLYFTSSRDHGLTWTPPLLINQGATTGDHLMPVLAAAPGEELLLVWRDARSGDPDIYLDRSLDGGLTWVGNQRLNSDTGTAMQDMPSMAVARDGRVAVAWSDWRTGGKPSIYLKERLGQNANFGPDQVVQTADSVAASPAPLSIGFPAQRSVLATGAMPALTFDGAGNLYLAWRDQFIFSVRGLRLAKRPPGGTWQASTLVINGDYRPGNPSLVVDRSNNLHMLFSRFLSPSENIRQELRWTWLPGNCRTCTWSAPIRANDLPPTVTVSALSGKLMLGPEGGIWTAWNDNRSPENLSDAYLAHLDLCEAGFAGACRVYLPLTRSR